jgi:hypothetical protein
VPTFYVSIFLVFYSKIITIHLTKM